MLWVSVKEINYKNKEKEIITINSFNEQTGPPPPPPPNGLTVIIKSVHVVIESVILYIEYWKDHCLLLVQRVSDQYLILSILKGD